MSLHTDETVRVFKMSKKGDSVTNTAQVAFDFPKVANIAILHFMIWFYAMIMPDEICA